MFTCHCMWYKTAHTDMYGLPVLITVSGIGGGQMIYTLFVRTQNFTPCSVWLALQKCPNTLVLKILFVDHSAWWRFGVPSVASCFRDTVIVQVVTHCKWLIVEPPDSQVPLMSTTSIAGVVTSHFAPTSTCLTKLAFYLCPTETLAVAAYSLESLVLTDSRKKVWLVTLDTNSPWSELVTWANWQLGDLTVNHWSRQRAVSRNTALAPNIGLSAMYSCRYLTFFNSQQVCQMLKWSGWFLRALLGWWYTVICDGWLGSLHTVQLLVTSWFWLCADNGTLVKVGGTGTMPSPRSAATIAAVNSKLYLFGGLSNDCGWLGDFFVFDTGRLQQQACHCYCYHVRLVIYWVKSSCI